MTVHLRGSEQVFDGVARIGPGAADRPSGLYGRVGKRLLDVALVLCAAPVVLLLVVPLILLVALDGHSPFYSQMRVGRGGQSFRMWKLRSMVPQADLKLDAYLAANPAARAEWDHSQKLRHDPRITPAGRLIRKTSLDELPQLWNVFVGDMSLVGPRPMMENQRDLYPGQDYYALRPGITGMWQISARNESSFARRARFDALYRRSMSLRTDIRLLFATVRVVLQATGN